MGSWEASAADENLDYIPAYVHPGPARALLEMSRLRIVGAFLLIFAIVFLVLGTLRRIADSVSTDVLLIPFSIGLFVVGVLFLATRTSYRQMFRG